MEAVLVKLWAGIDAGKAHHHCGRGRASAFGCNSFRPVAYLRLKSAMGSDPWPSISCLPSSSGASKAASKFFLKKVDQPSSGSRGIYSPLTVLGVNFPDRKI
jgi:hypothetical protein